MRRPITIKHEMEKLASHSGLINIGALLDAINFKMRFDTINGVHCVDPKFSHSDVLASMIALISIGKPDYDAIEIFREKQAFFNKAIGIRACPSSPTLQQRIDLIGHQADILISQACADLVRSCSPAISPIQTSAGTFLPLDMDVSPFNNAKTQKEGVSRTYKGVDGFAPIFAYLGRERYLVNLELREGKQHCQKNTPAFIGRTLENVRKITDQPILMRLDSGNDSQDNFPASLEESDPTELPGIRRKKVARRRIRTLIQDLMYMAERLVTRARRWYISFGQLNPFSKMIERIYHRLNLLSATQS